MANIYEGKANFIQGLSDLWIRFFKDQDQLRTLYDGTQILVGQAYLEFMSTILNISIRETPVFQKEFFKLLTMREDNVSQRAADGKYIFEVTDILLKGADFLYNKIFSPTTILEEGIDFEVEIDGDADLISFTTDPFNWIGDDNPIPGVPYRTVNVVADDGSVTAYRELALWIPDAQIDQYDMYLNYGYLIKRFEPSSEAYRALLQGVINYFVLGPTDQHVTSALNVIVGLPVVREEGEVLQSVDTSNPAYRTIVTNQNQYQFDVVIPLREDILDEANWGVLTFEAFEHLTTVFTVYDNINNPTWWFDVTVPPRVLPDQSKARRAVSPQLYENKIDNPPGLVKVGDPGFFIGADTEGFVPTTRIALRNLFSYVVFERFLKHHTFAVVFDSQVLLSDVIPFPRLGLDVQQVVIAGRSAYTVLYLEPGLVFYDSIYVAADDETDLDIAVTLDPDTEIMTTITSSLTVSEKSWQVGDYYWYDVGGVQIRNESTDPIGTRFEDGKTPLVIGGSDITHRTRELATGSGDWGSPSGNQLDVGVDTFDDTDVGRWVRKGSTGNVYYQIVTVDTAQVVTIDATITPDTDDWTLYDYENGHETPAMTDWGVQIRVF